MQIVKNGLQPTVSPFILTIVGTLRPVAFRPICFHIDETISLSFIGYVPLPQPIACCVLPYGIVVEPSPIRSLVADCPMIIIFKHSHLSLFHLYVVVYNPLRGFQQFNRFNVSYQLTHAPSSGEVCVHIAYEPIRSLRGLVGR